MKLYVGKQPTRRNEHKTGTEKQQQGGEGGPSTRRDNLYTAFRREDTKLKYTTEEKENTEDQERKRFPSTALLAHETREKTVLIPECRESLELPRQPADDAAVAARLVLAEKNNITPDGSANHIPNKRFLQKEEVRNRVVDNP